MSREVPIEHKHQVLELINAGVGQREISRLTGLSRPYIKKLAKSIGVQFPRNGYEVRPMLCMCLNCSLLFRRPKSKVDRADHNFCSMVCKSMYSCGANNKNYKGEKTNITFSQWLTGQKGYKMWREAVLKRDNYTCQITGLTGVPLEAHHIFPKAEYQHMALDIDNGIAVSEEAHLLVHKLIREGFDFDQAVEEAKKRISKID